MLRVPITVSLATLAQNLLNRTIGCIGEIIGFYRSLTDKETSYIHKYLMKKWGDTADPI